MDCFLAQLLQIRLETLQLRLEHIDLLTGAPVKDTMKSEERIEIEREMKEIKEQIKLMDIENDF
jgi:tRNA (Thr-GGU) A37 N-methylase